MKRLEKNILHAGLYSSKKDREHIYKDVDVETKNNPEWVKKQFKYIKDEQAFLGIVQKLAKKYDMTLYDAALMVFAGCNAIQDTFEAISAPRIKEHFAPNWKRDLPFTKNKRYERIMDFKHDELNDAIKRECSSDYFSLIQKTREFGVSILKCFHRVNRLRKMGIPKKINFRSKLFSKFIYK